MSDTERPPIDVAQVAPKHAYGISHHPDTGEAAPAGYMWCRNAAYGGWFLEHESTPFTTSAASETYWST